MQEICRRKDQKEPYAAHCHAGGIIKLDQPAQGDRRNDAGDSGDKKSSNKITSGDVSNQTHRPWKQWVKREGTIPCAVTKFCDFSVISEIPLVPYLKPIVRAWLGPVPKHGITLHANEEQK